MSRQPHIGETLQERMRRVSEERKSQEMFDSTEQALKYGYHNLSKDDDNKNKKGGTWRKSYRNKNKRSTGKKTRKRKGRSSRKTKHRKRKSSKRRSKRRSRH